MSVSEDTAKRIADALERLAKVMEGDPVIPPMPPKKTVICINCGGNGGFHALDCPLLQMGAT